MQITFKNYRYSNTLLTCNPKLPRIQIMLGPKKLEQKINCTTNNWNSGVGRVLQRDGQGKQLGDETEITKILRHRTETICCTGGHAAPPFLIKKLNLLRQIPLHSS